MGCYNSVMFKCLECGFEIEVQSKHGTCNMTSYYNPNEAPLEDMIGINGKSVKCAKCGREYTVVLTPHVWLR